MGDVERLIGGSDVADRVLVDCAVPVRGGRGGVDDRQGRVNRDTGDLLVAVAILVVVGILAVYAILAVPS